MSLKIRTELSDLGSAKDFEVKASGYTFSLAIQRLTILKSSHGLWNRCFLSDSSLSLVVAENFMLIHPEYLSCSSLKLIACIHNIQPMVSVIEQRKYDKHR